MKEFHHTYFLKKSERRNIDGIHHKVMPTLHKTVAPLDYIYV